MPANASEGGRGSRSLPVSQIDPTADPFSKLLAAVLVLCLAAMVVMVFGNVVLRYVFNSGITMSEELSRWLFVWMTFLGAVLAVRDRGHLGSDMLVSRLGPTGKKACLVAGLLLMLVINALLLQGSLAQTRINLDVEAPVSGLPMAVVYAAGVVFAVCAGALQLHQLWRVLTGRLSDEDLVMVQESEDLAQLKEEDKQ